MKKYEITPEHMIELEKIKQKYIANALRTDAMSDYDKDQMRLCARGLYKNANLPYPGDEKIIFVSSPLVAQYASGWAMARIHGRISEKRDENAAVDAAENAAVDAADAAAENAAVDAAEAAVRGAARAAVDAADAVPAR